jgi:hypothetical protein
VPEIVVVLPGVQVQVTPGGQAVLEEPEPDPESPDDVLTLNPALVPPLPLWDPLPPCPPCEPNVLSLLPPQPLDDATARMAHATVTAVLRIRSAREKPARARFDIVMGSSAFVSDGIA